MVEFNIACVMVRTFLNQNFAWTFFKTPKCLFELFHGVSLEFSNSKFISISTKSYYHNNKVVAAIDDSPRHIDEYTSHGIKTLAPVYPYNKHMENKNLFRFDIDNIT